MKPIIGFLISLFILVYCALILLNYGETYQSIWEVKSQFVERNNRIFIKQSDERLGGGLDTILIYRCKDGEYELEPRKEFNRKLLRIKQLKWAWMKPND